MTLLKGLGRFFLSSYGCLNYTKASGQTWSNPALSRVASECRTDIYRHEIPLVIRQSHSHN